MSSSNHYNDSRRKDRYENQQKRFRNHTPRTQKDAISCGRNKNQLNSNDTGRRFNRAQTRCLAEETVAITSGSEGDRRYVTDKGTEIDISKKIELALAHTVTYDPEASKQLAESVNITEKHDTEFEVELETSLAGSQRFHEYDDYPDAKIGVLNFASAKHPGGGFLNGSMAQEESLAIASALYHMIKDSPMYRANIDNPNSSLYNHYLICSPDTPVFRDDNGDYLEEPYLVTFLTVPSVNAGDARIKGVADATIVATMFERADRMLASALAHNVDVLVLGSWGCGVFGGDIKIVANMFVKLLTEKYEGAFKAISFSVLDETHRKVFESELDSAFK